MSGDKDSRDREDEPGFASRWSRLKREAKADAPEPEAEAGAVEPEAPVDDDRPDEEVLEELGLPDPDTLKPGDNFTAFMARAVPARLRNRALRRLWISDPVLANLDELLDYGEDFTDAATVIENLQTAYQVGKGYIDKVAGSSEGDGESPEEPLEESPGEPAGESPEASDEASDQAGKEMGEEAGAAEADPTDSAEEAAPDVAPEQTGVPGRARPRGVWRRGDSGGVPRVPEAGLSRPPGRAAGGGAGTGLDPRLAAGERESVLCDRGCHRKARQPRHHPAQRRRRWLRRCDRL